jgi:uncharacterized membrane protein YeaQ/YmgE (transglycosylase-associated protein family)
MKRKLFYMVFLCAFYVLVISGLSMAVMESPTKISTFTATTNNQIKLSWIAPSENINIRGAMSVTWIIKYSTNPASTPNTAENTVNISSNWVFGASESYVLRNLISETTYYIWIKAKDSFGVESLYWSDRVIARSGIFEDTGANIIGLRYSTLSFGDYDNDGDLDLVVAGYDGSNCVSRIYRNDNGVFIDINAGLTGVTSSSLSWGDYDNDGDLDLALSGDTTLGFVSKIYRNDNGVFTDINAGLTGVCHAGVSWGDYDNDGDLDLAIAGWTETGSENTSKIYRNDNGIFTDINAGLIGLTHVSLSWGDYDNDGDLDLLIAGNTGAGNTSNVTKIYRNDNGIFNDISANLIGLGWSSVSFGDYDNDGDLDFAIEGWTGLENITKIYRNDNGVFRDINARLIGVGYGSLSFGDYDNDGDLDLIVTGSIGTANIIKIYKNDNGTFNDIGETGLTKIYEGSLSLGDYDFDGDLDLAITGYDGPGYDGHNCVTKIYKSNMSKKQTNNAPNAPTNLSSNYDANTKKLKLTWDKAIDEKTKSEGLYYEVRVATQPINENLKNWIVSVTKGFGTGYNSAQRLGNYPHGYISSSSTVVNAGVILSSVTINTTYYWQCRAMNPSLKKSMWSNQASIYISGLEPGKITDLTARTDSQIKLIWTASGENGYTGNVTNGEWKIKYSSNPSSTPDTAERSVIISSSWICGSTQTYVLTGLMPEVTYYFWIKAKNGAGKECIEWSNRAIAISGIYEDIAANLPGLMTSSLSFGDYDNDGDLDLAIAGYSASEGVVTKIYRNDNGVFTDIGAGLIGVGHASLSWGDYDNDGDLDLAVAGVSDIHGLGEITKIYRNDGNGIFTDINAGIPGVYFGSISWGDYDNDGKLDLAIAGWNASTPITKIYKNNGNGVFTDINAGLIGVHDCSLSWGDYDNDGDLDLVIGGQTSSSYSITKIYRNDGIGIFTDINANLAGSMVGNLCWGDYDNDGDLDLAITGYADPSAITKIYRNDNGVFTDIGAGILGLYDSSICWGDYNNDGNLDLLSAGYYVGSGTDVIHVTKIYKNNGNGIFTNINAGLIGVSRGDLSFGDYNNDGSLDIALTGDTGSGYITKIYKSNISKKQMNNAPAVPANLSSNYDANTKKLKLTWDKSTDEKTKTEGLYYEVRVATQPINENLNNWVVSVTKGLGTGYNSAQRLGNYPHGYISSSSTIVNAGLILSSIPARGTYYWQVRAMDPGLRKSAWSNQASISVEPIYIPGKITDLNAFTITSSQIKLVWTAPGENGYVGDVTNGEWKIKYSSNPSATADTAESSMTISSSWICGSTQTVMLTGLGVNTTYYIWLKAKNGQGNECLEWSDKVIIKTGALFEDIWANIEGVYRGNISWGDYDNDGDLDLAIAGLSLSEGAKRIAKIYRNDGAGIFTDIGANIGGYDTCSLSWGDYDNDGDLDLGIIGSGFNSECETKIFRNDGNGIFTDIRAGITVGYFGSISWGDYDNDGDLDLLVAGWCETNNAVTRIYRNDGNGKFTNINANLVGIYEGDLEWADYDNDGDLDFAISGQISVTSGAISAIYRNDGNGVFTNINAGLRPSFDSTLSWGDYNNDGYLDLAIFGFACGKIYKNNKNGTFTDINANLDTITNGSASWGDYDKDGNLDLIVIGHKQDGLNSANVSEVYKNNNGIFSGIDLGIAKLDYTGLSLGDYDNDGNLDIALTGLNGTSGLTTVAKIYRSLLSPSNKLIKNNLNTITSDKNNIIEQSFTFNGKELKVVLEIPKGAINGSGYVNFEFNPLYSPSNKLITANNVIQKADSKLTLSKLGIMVKFSLYNMQGNKINSFLKPVKLTISYLDENSDGIIDETDPKLNELLLKMYSLDDTKAEWVLAGGNGGIIDTKNNTITAEINSSSLYMLASSPAPENNLVKAKVYPNPYKPGTRGDFDRKGGVLFDNLTRKAKIKIYTITGDLVREINKDNFDRTYEWNTENDYGKKLASGVYIYIITNPDKGGDKAKGKIAIIK